MTAKGLTPPAEKPPYGDIALENRVGNKLSYERMQQIRKTLLHFNWCSERASLLLQLSMIDVYGDVDHEAQTGSFYDYREQGWIVARVVPR
jgi:hypothetical protein